MARNSRSSNNTDGELLRSFLYNKVHNIPVPNHINVLEYDLFGTIKNPWEIWEEFATSHSYHGKDLYFFTTLKKKSATSKRLIRTIGIGTWEAEDSGIRIVDKETDQTLGLKKRFRFEKSNTSHDGGWILHEYSLHKSLTNNALANNYVLCRFRKNLKPNPQNKGTRLDHQSNSHLMNSIGQDRQGKTVVPGPTENAISGSNVSRKSVHEEPKSQSNGGHKRRKVGNTWPENTVVLGLKAITNTENNDVWLGENIDPNSRNQFDSGNIKTGVVKSTNTIEAKFNKEDGDRIINKDEDDDISWPELFARQLIEMNGGSLIEEEDVQMLPNSSRHCHSSIW